MRCIRRAPLLLLLCLWLPGAASLDPAEEARRLLREGQHQEALALLKREPLERLGPAPLAMLGVAAAASGERALAQQAFERARTSTDLPMLASLALDARLLGVCTPPCSVPMRSHGDVLAAPLPIQARYLYGLARTDKKTARSFARAIVDRAAYLDRAHPSSARAELLSAAYTALEESGDRAGARALELTAWEHLPMEPGLQYLVRPVDAKRVVAERGAPSLVTHLEAMEEARQNHVVIGMGTALCGGTVVTDKALCPKVDAPLRCRVAFIVGKALRQARKPDDAEPVLGAVAARCPELAERALYLQARAAMAIRGAGPRAIAALEALGTRFPQSNLADDAWVLAGETAARSDDLTTARRHWQHAINAHPDGDLIPQAVRFLVMADVDGGALANAQQDLRSMLKEGGDPDRWRWAAYWNARLSTDPGALIQGLEQVITRAPYSFEAALARGVLRAQGTGLPAAPKLPRAEPIGAPARMDALASSGLVLLKLGLEADAVVMLREALRDAPAGAGDFVAQQLLDAGDAPTVSRWARVAHTGVLHGSPTPSTMARWHLAYPRAHAAAIEAASAESGVPVALLYALAREESAFDHSVNSLSGAIGLFQLLPATAITEALPLKIRLDNEFALKDPTVNARLGAAYLARQLRLFNGNPALALAAYNAGPGSVHKWLKEDPEARLDLFIERIPIDETRDYVKRVLRSFAVYTALLHDGATLELPGKAADRMQGF